MRTDVFRLWILGEQKVFFDPGLKLSLTGSLSPSSGGERDKRCHYPPHGNESFQMTQEVKKREKRRRLGEIDENTAEERKVTEVKLTLGGSDFISFHYLRTRFVNFVDFDTFDSHVTFACVRTKCKKKKTRSKKRCLNKKQMIRDLNMEWAFQELRWWRKEVAGIRKKVSFLPCSMHKISHNFRPFYRRRMFYFSLLSLFYSLIFSHFSLCLSLFIPFYNHFQRNHGAIKRRPFVLQNNCQRTLPPFRYKERFIPSSSSITFFMMRPNASV